MPFINLSCFHQRTQRTHWAGWHRQLGLVGGSALISLTKTTAALITQLKSGGGAIGINDTRRWRLISVFTNWNGHYWPTVSSFHPPLLNQKQGASHCIGSVYSPLPENFPELNTSVVNCLCATVTWLVFISFHFPFLSAPLPSLTCLMGCSLLYADAICSTRQLCFWPVSWRYSALSLSPRMRANKGERLALVSALSFHRFVLLRMPALAVWEGGRDNVLLCIWQNGNEGRKEGYLQILHISRSSVTLSVSRLFRACKAGGLRWILKVNPWRRACAPPQAYSRLPPVVSAAAPLSACSRCGRRSIPEAWD